MSAINAAMVKALREATGVGMMECKKALVECEGDADKARDLLRIRSGAKADKVSGRTATEGRIAVGVANGVGVLVEVNCETDFVARDDNFSAFCDALAEAVAAQGQSDDIAAVTMSDGRSAEEARQQLVMKMGENVNFGRVLILSGNGAKGHYIHTGDKIAAMVEYENGDESLARDICMHIAALRPQYLSPQDVADEDVAKEREIFAAQAAASDKPPAVIEKMISGKLNKHFAEYTLLRQPFVKDGDKTVEEVLSAAGMRLHNFRLLIVGAAD